MTSWSAYDPKATAEVCSTLAITLRSFGPAREHLTVVGGLAPGLLVPTPVTAAHVGTTDVDICLTVALAEGGTGYYDTASDALRRNGFTQEPFRAGPGFRWALNGIKVEFLYPAGAGERPLAHLRRGEDWESSALRSLGPDFAALAVGSPALLQVDRRLTRFNASVSGGTVTEDVHVAGPTAFCAMKAAAIRGRLNDKDAYDVVWLLNELGPEAAAAEAIDLGRRGADLRAEVEQTATALAEDFAVGRNGPAWYANFLATNDDRDRSQLEREATDIVGTWAAQVLAASQRGAPDYQEDL